jgi:putative transposase
MARPLRIEYEGAFYHVTARGNERKRVFFAKADYGAFKGYLREAKEKYGIRLHCYVLMTNHYHLLVETPKANLSRLMHYLNGSYTNYLNRKRRRSGHLFQGRYKAIVVERDSYLLELSRYLHLNPVRARLVAKPEDYPYSSYRAYVSRGEDDLIERDLILGMMSGGRGDGRRLYREFVERVLGEELENPFKGVYGGMILGGNRFIKEVLGKLKDRVLEGNAISQRRELRTGWGREAVVEAVCRHFRFSREEFFQDRGLARKVAIYLMRKHTGMTNGEIGEIFGGLTYSAVAKARERFAGQLSTDRTLRRTIQEITAIMSYVKP